MPPLHEPREPFLLRIEPGRAVHFNQKVARTAIGEEDDARDPGLANLPGSLRDKSDVAQPEVDDGLSHGYPWPSSTFGGPLNPRTDAGMAHYLVQRKTSRAMTSRCTWFVPSKIWCNLASRM